VHNRSGSENYGKVFGSCLYLVSSSWHEVPTVLSYVSNVQRKLAVFFSLLVQVSVSFLSVKSHCVYLRWRHIARDINTTPTVLGFVLGSSILFLCPMQCVAGLFAIWSNIELQIMRRRS